MNLSRDYRTNPLCEGEDSRQQQVQVLLGVGSDLLRARESPVSHADAHCTFGRVPAAFALKLEDTVLLAMLKARMDILAWLIQLANLVAGVA